MWYVYLLKSKRTTSLYIGATGDLRKRVKQHNAKQYRNSFTSRYAPWALAYYEAYGSREDAFEREKALKKYGASLAQLKKRANRSLESAG